MLSAHTVGDIRAAEEALAATLPDGELMQRAARGLADRLDLIPAGDVVLCLIGPGNNGGDALYAATHLLDRGVRVDLCLLDEAAVHAGGLAAATAAGAQVVGSAERAAVVPRRDLRHRGAPGSHRQGRRVGRLDR